MFSPRVASGLRALGKTSHCRGRKKFLLGVSGRADERQAKCFKRSVLACHELKCPDELSNGSTGNAPLVSPQYACVCEVRHSPLSIQNLKIDSVVCHQDTCLGGGKGELLLICHPSPVQFMDGDGINSLTAQTFGHTATQIFIEQEPQAHTPLFSAMRASISSGYLS